MEVVVVSALRTPFGKFCGTLRETPTYVLGAMVIEEALKRVKLQKEMVDQVFMGTAIHAENEDFIAPVMARQALLKAGLPPQTKSMTIDKACCSSMSAIHLAFNAIRWREADIVVAVGAENFSRVPFIVHHGVRLGQGPRLGNINIRDPLLRMGYKDYNPVSVDAGEVALAYGVTREDQDRWAVLSQARYQEAKRLGKFKDEIVPVRVEVGREEVLFEEDEFPKPGTTMEKLQRLETVYGSPTVTAGNAPGLNDGASCMVLMSLSKAAELGIRPLARIVAIGSHSDLPKNITIVPALVIQQILEKAKIMISDIDLLEINEAFAAMPVTCAKILAAKDAALEERIRSRLNINGGAIAIGHPLGASAIRITLTLMYELLRRGGGRGISAICGGLAQGEGLLLETM
ncbi:MAG: thiolase family protein [Thermodesulfobacteriota bacterium]